LAKKLPRKRFQPLALESSVSLCGGGSDCMACPQNLDLAAGQSLDVGDLIFLFACKNGILNLFK
jgi:hypothetical protein